MKTERSLKSFVSFCLVIASLGLAACSDGKDGGGKDGKGGNGTGGLENVSQSVPRGFISNSNFLMGSGRAQILNTNSGPRIQLTLWNGFFANVCQIFQGSNKFVLGSTPAQLGVYAYNWNNGVTSTEASLTFVDMGTNPSANYIAQEATWAIDQITSTSIRGRVIGNANGQGMLNEVNGSFEVPLCQ